MTEFFIPLHCMKLCSRRFGGNLEGLESVTYSFCYSSLTLLYVEEEELEERRPESVLFEVRHLSNVRPVTSLLQTQAFRRQLETAVRGNEITFSSLFFLLS